jgi:hypothetical protein
VPDYCVTFHMTVIFTVTAVGTSDLTTYRMLVISIILCSPTGRIKLSKRKTSCLKSSNFFDMASCSPLKVKRRFGRICRLNLQGVATYFTLVSCLAYASSLKTEATCSSVGWLSTAAQRRIPDVSLHNHRCENLKSSVIKNGNDIRVTGRGGP